MRGPIVATGLGAALLFLCGCNAHPFAAAQRVGTACLGLPAIPDPAHPRTGMVYLRGGAFDMGAAPLRLEEGPRRRVRVAPFWIDRTDITNADFARFVASTGYRTLAERPLDPRLYPALSPRQRQPASLVFVGAEAGSDDPAEWWRIVPGADWRHPQGPGSTIAGQGAMPVVHVAWEDARAYARWLGRDLPTEAQW